MRDRRKEQRWPAFLAGTISFNRRLSVADCIVRNTSSFGARLVFHNTPFVPDEFELTIAQKNIECRVRTCWRRFDEIGVEIQERQPAERPALSLQQARRLHRLEQENASLRRQLALTDRGE
jgi:hypothetical protein